VSVFEAILGPWNIELAVLEMLETWMPSYLAEVERKNSLPNKYLGRPPTPESYKGGLDFESVSQDRCPAVIVNANPVGEPSRLSSAFIQDFQVEVGCVVISEEGTDPEASARKRAGLMSAATMLLQHQPITSIPTYEETILTGAPRVEFLEPERREIAVGITTWHVFATILEPNAGPAIVKAVEPEAEYPEGPEVLTEHLTVKAL
jgi:hypothetical protein